MDRPTALQKAGFVPKTPRGLRHRTNVPIDASQYTSSYIPPSKPLRPQKPTSLGPEAQKEEETFDEEVKAARKKGFKCLLVKIRALFDRFAQNDMIRVNLDKGLVHRWELRVWSALVRKGDMIAAYKEGIKRQQQRLDQLGESWDDETKGPGNSGRKIFRKAVKICMEEEEEEALFATPALAPPVTDHHPISKYSSADTTAYSPDYSTSSDREAALNAEEFNKDVLPHHDVPRWQNRRDIQQSLRDLMGGVAHTDPLKQLSVTEFASALETEAWEGQTDEPNSYEDRVADVLQDFNAWQTLWDSDEADECRRMTGYQMFEELVSRVTAIKFRHNTPPSQRSLDDELAELGGYTSADADGETDPEYDDTESYEVDRWEKFESLDNNIAAFPSHQNVAGGPSTHPLESQKEVQVSPASPSLSEQGPTGDSLDVPEDYPINSETAPHYEWPPPAYNYSLPPAVPSYAWPTDESGYIWPADDSNDALLEDLDFEGMLANIENLIGAGNETVPENGAGGVQGASLSASLDHNTAPIPQQTHWQLSGLTFDIPTTTGVTVRDQAWTAPPVLAPPMPTLVGGSNHTDFEGYGKQDDATNIHAHQIGEDLQRAITPISQRPLPPFSSAPIFNTIEATPNVTQPLGFYNPPRDLTNVPEALANVVPGPELIQDVQMGDSWQSVQYDTAGTEEATHSRPSTMNAPQQPHEDGLYMDVDESMDMLFDWDMTESSGRQETGTDLLIPPGDTSVVNQYPDLNITHTEGLQHPQFLTSNPFNLEHLPGFDALVGNASRPALFSSIGPARPAEPVPSDFGWKPSNGNDVVPVSKQTLHGGAIDYGFNNLSNLEPTNALDVPSAITSNPSASNQADSIMNDTEPHDDSDHDSAKETTGPSPATSSERPPLFMTHNLNFDMPMATKSFTPQTKFVIDFGADTADLSNLKQELRIPRKDLSGVLAVSEVAEGQQTEPSAEALEPTTEDVGVVAQDGSTDDLSPALAEQFLLEKEAPEPSQEPQTSKASSAFVLVPKGQAIQTLPAMESRTVDLSTWEQGALQSSPSEPREAQQSVEVTQATPSVLVLEPEPASVDTAKDDGLVQPLISDNNASSGVISDTQDPVHSSPTPQNKVLKAQLEMIMNDQAEKHKDLVERLEAMKAMMANLHRAGIQDEKQELSDLACNLEKDVANFGKLTEKDVIKELSHNSGMATVPEEEEELKMLAEEPQKDTVVARQAKEEVAKLALRFGIDVANNKILSTQKAVSADTQKVLEGWPLPIKLPFRTKVPIQPEETMEPIQEAQPNVQEIRQDFHRVQRVQKVPQSPSKHPLEIKREEDLAGVNGRAAQWGAQQAEKGELRKAEDEALRLHQQNPTQRPAALARVGMASTQIARHINEWYSKTQHGLPEVIFECGEALIDAYHDVDKSDSRRALKELRKLINRWAALRKVIAAYREFQRDFEGATRQVLEQQWAAYDNAAQESQERDTLRRHMKKELDPMVEHYEELFDAVSELKQCALEMFEAEAFGEMLDKTVTDSRHALRFAYNNVDIPLPDSLVDILAGVAS